MARVLLSRLVQLPLILAMIYVITYFLCVVAPGSPFATERALSPEVRRSLEERFHARNSFEFLTYYPLRALQGDLGPSMASRGWAVNDIIAGALPVSMTLGVFAITLALFVGVAVGTLAAVKRGGLLDWTSLSVTLIGISLPGFVVAALLLLMSSLPAFAGIFAIGRWEKPIDVLLPGIALSLAPMAYIARLTRVSMLDILGADFVRTARAKGLSKSWVIWKHCLRNALLPVLSYLGPAAAGTLTGSFVVETVFGIKGMGEHFVTAILKRDQTMILGVVMVYSTLLLLLNLLVDVLYAVVDPRIDLSAKGK